MGQLSSFMFEYGLAGSVAALVPYVVFGIGEWWPVLAITAICLAGILVGASKWKEGMKKLEGEE